MSASGFWSKRRRLPEEGQAARPVGWSLTAVDRCDRCSAQAYVRVVFAGGLDLLFCAHHNRQYAAALAELAVGTQDETHRLARPAALS